MEFDELLGQCIMTRAVVAQERSQRKGPMSGCFLFDRNADPERRMAVLDEGSEALAKSAGTGKQIDNSES